jgi:hypothetical protein
MTKHAGMKILHDKVYFDGKYMYKCLQEQILILCFILNWMISWCLTKTTSWYDQFHTTVTSAEKKQMVLGRPFRKINLSSYTLKASRDII